MCCCEQIAYGTAKRRESLYLLLESPQLGACSQPPSTSCPSPPLISAMQTAQQHAWIWSVACSLLTDGISCGSFSPRAVAEQEVLLDPLQRLAGIGELGADFARSVFALPPQLLFCFFGGLLLTWPP